MAAYQIYIQHKKTNRKMTYCGNGIWDDFSDISNKPKVYKTFKNVLSEVKKLSYLADDYKFYACDYEDCSDGAELNVRWDDGMTVETRYFGNRKQAEDFALRNGYVDYYITAIDRQIVFD